MTPSIASQIDAANEHIRFQADQLSVAAAKLQQSDVERTLLANECTRLRSVIELAANELRNLHNDPAGDYFMAARFPRVEGAKDGE